MIRLTVALFLVFHTPSCLGQNSPERGRTINSAFDQKIASSIGFTVPIITVKQLEPSVDSYVLLDAREREEYEVSHIDKARFIGYKNVDVGSLNIAKETPIVIYCSIGYRSEKIGEMLQEQGYSEVYNLYGSIFEWVNQGNPVVDMKGAKSSNIHTYNRKWSAWVEREGIQKVW